MRDAIAKAVADLKGAVTRYEQFTAVLEALRKLKATKLKAVNIQGLRYPF